MTTFPELPNIDKALSLIEEIGEIGQSDFRWDSYAKQYRERTESKSLFCYRNADRKWAKVENITGMGLPG